MAIASNATADVSAPSQAQARVLVIKARTEFDAGHYAESAMLLEQALRLVDSSAVLYNLAWSYQHAGEREKAAAAYERYLQREPNASDANLVRRTLAQLRTEIAERRELADVATRERARADAEAEARRKAEADRTRLASAVRGPSSLPWIGGGVGVGGIVAGAILGVLASAAHQNAVADPDALSASAKQTSARSLAVGANLSFIAGALLAGVGLIWGIVDLTGSSAERRREMTLTWGIGSLRVELTF